MQAKVEHIQIWLANHAHLLTLDFARQGARTSDRKSGMELFAGNVVGSLQRLAVSKTHIFGYRSVGYVALNRAKKHPALVNKIMTLGTKFDWTLEAAKKEIQLLNPTKIEEKVPAFAK